MGSTKKAREHARRKALSAAGSSIAELSRKAGVTWQMAQMWVKGDRTSKNVSDAFETIVGGERDRAA